MQYVHFKCQQNTRGSDQRVKYEDIFENCDKGKDTKNEENDTKMNTTDRNTKVKVKAEYNDVFKDSDKSKDNENDEKRLN